MQSYQNPKDLLCVWKKKNPFYNSYGITRDHKYPEKYLKKKLEVLHFLISKVTTNLP